MLTKHWIRLIGILFAVTLLSACDQAIEDVSYVGDCDNYTLIVDWETIGNNNHSLRQYAHDSDEILNSINIGSNGGTFQWRGFSCHSDLQVWEGGSCQFDVAIVTEGNVSNKKSFEINC